VATEPAQVTLSESLHAAPVPAQTARAPSIWHFRPDQAQSRLVYSNHRPQPLAVVPSQVGGSRSPQHEIRLHAALLTEVARPSHTPPIAAQLTV